MSAGLRPIARRSDAVRRVRGSAARRAAARPPQQAQSPLKPCADHEHNPIFAPTTPDQLRRALGLQGCGIVEFETPEEAAMAIQTLNDQDVRLTALPLPLVHIAAPYIPRRVWHERCK